MLQTASLSTTRSTLLGASARQLVRSIACGSHTSTTSPIICTRQFSLASEHKDRSQGSHSRHFSFSAKVPKEFFPEAHAPQIRYSKAAWSHPIYTEQQMKDIYVAHRETKNWSDYVAFGAVRLLRWGLDIATGYKHGKEVAKAVTAGTKHKPFAMTEKKYMIRNVFLESVAGVPGSVAGMLRHLHSMRRMTRDHGWVGVLLLPR